MKRIICLLLVLLTLFSLSGCALLRDGWEETQSELWTEEIDIPIITRAPDGNPTEAGQPTEPTKDSPSTEAPASETEAPEPVPTEAPAESGPRVTEDGVYDSKEEVALYIHLYHHLPSNYITKKEAEKLGWVKGGLEPYAPGKCIGGSYFGNYEGQLPKAKGRSWTECDIGTMGKNTRGTKRIVFSNDGLIYYTADHYEHFELLYDGWED